MAKEKVDVLVIGGGSAAHEAAIAARQAGARRVLMLEKAPQPEFGGNARYSHTGFRFVHAGKDEVRRFVPDFDARTYEKMHIPPYSAEQFTADLDRVTQGRIDAALARKLVDGSNEAVHWMRESGVVWEPEKTTEVAGKLYMEPGINIHPIGGGPGLLEQLRRIAAGLDVEIRYEARVIGVHGNANGVEGVRVLDPEREYDVGAGAIICCAGGFQANPEMRARYLGPNADTMKVRGSKHNTGEVLMLLLGLGAKAAGHWQGAHMTPIDAKAPDVETPIRADGRGNMMNRYDYNFGITVNALGARFYDEGEAKISYTYAKTGRAVLGQPGGVAYQIYDDTGIELFRHGRDYPATMVEAPTIRDLAAKIGVEPDVLDDTVSRFNAACRKDVAFDPSKPDGKCTEGLTPRKSHWAVPLDKPPFRAYPITAGVTFTFGGLGVNERAEVLNSSLRPIKRLFASGDIVGLFFHNYPSCTGQTRNAVFSLAAGRNAAALSG